MSGVFWLTMGTPLLLLRAHKLVKHIRYDLKSEKSTSFILPKNPYRY